MNFLISCRSPSYNIVCTSTTSNSQWALTSIYIFSKIISIEVLPSSASTKISVWSITWPHHHNIHRTAALVWMLRSPVLVNNLSNSGLGFVFVGMMSLRAARCRAASCQLPVRACTDRCTELTFWWDYTCILECPWNRGTKPHLDYRLVVERNHVLFP